jgi:hypothetical protein
MKAIKTTYSLSQEAAVFIEAAARRVAEGNDSLVVDVAIKHFATLDGAEQRRLIARQLAERSATTRDGWQMTFWRWLAGSFNAEDRVSNAYAPRTYDGYMVVFLMTGRSGAPEETDGFEIHVTALKDDVQSDRRTWSLPRTASPIDAADAVADWIRERSSPAASPRMEDFAALNGRYSGSEPFTAAE